jgi:hypothetical protein
VVPMCGDDSARVEVVSGVPQLRGSAGVRV